MRLKTRTWFLLSVVLFLAAALFWRLGNQHSARSHAPAPAAAAPSFALNLTNYVATTNVPKPVFPLAMVPPPNAPVTNRFALRLSNTKQPFGELLRNERAVLLRNALIDTALPGRLEIPEHLQAKGDPGSYIVQARGPITQAFRDRLTQSGAEIISYVPNNAYLVRASEETARNIAASPNTQPLLTYEPYYKLDARLLPLAVRQEPSPYAVLNVVAFPGQTESVRRQLELLGATLVAAPEPTLFGDILATRAPAYALVGISQIKEVQMVSVHSDKHPVNDLSRVKLKVSTDTITRPPLSHYGAPTTNDHLTGSGVLVAVADTGVDGNHPDLENRVFGLTTDFDGHGTHVIGSLLGDGTASPLSGSVNAYGSVTGAIFSGIAPKARAYVQDLNLPNSVLQRNTALTNALISNNSWGIDDNDYDITAASYDAAVRDSLPGVTGEQEVAYVFADGNGGGGGSDGLNGIAGSVLSPATAKNVITVGAIDQARFITNLVYRACDTNGICETNQPWLGMTDSDNQVSGYSARGNVGVGVEGVFGRFKPDVVAPGSMVVSARSALFDEPNGSTNTSVFQYNSVPFAYKATNLYSLNIPAEAISVTILVASNALSPTTNVDLLIGAGIDNIPTTFIASNSLTLDATTTPALTRGTLYYTIANLSYPNTAVLDLVVLLTYTNDVGNYYDVLKQLNDPLKPYYRYESGTSMAAPKVSGMLALMQEYLGTNFNMRPSPALLKALLINGARSLSLNYNLSSQAAINHQGWGLANISNSIPSGLVPSATNGPMRFFDQNTTNALTTGGTHVYQVTVPDEAKSYPLRITLVWSDAPGNPVAGVKLVNDLNLFVNGGATNVVGASTNSSQLLWLGNSFPPGGDFTSPITISSTDTNAATSTNLQQSIELARDPVNNVENVYIRPPLSGTYTVTVKGHRVNVNSVNSHSNSIVQDYALVVASGNVAPSNNVDLLVSGPVFTNDPSQRISALLRATNATSAGLLNQRVGANAPLIVSTNGATNQWAFFTYTNVPTANFTNVVILTFFPPELSLPRNRDADIDLYVTRGSDGTGTNLFVLDPAAVSISKKSTTRGGTEFVLFTDAQPDEVFSIGVKSEDQQAAQFSIFAFSSDRPPSSRDASNNIVARALPLPVAIPDGSPDAPGGTNLLIIVADPENPVVRRAHLTNSIYHEEAGDLIGILSHIDPADGSEESVTLNNHRTWTGSETVVYDDSEEGDLGDGTSTPPVIPPDGPGSLRDFVGQQANGLWNFTISDNALFHTGLVQELTLVIEPASTNSDNPVNLVRNILPLHWLYAAFNVPADASNIQVCVETDGPVDIYVRRGDFPTFNLYDKALTNIQPPGACLDLGLNDSPPLNPGRYYVGVYNPSDVTSVRVHLVVTIQRSLNPNRPQTIANNNGTFLIDDATTNSTILVTNRGIVTSVEVDVRIKHPRVSDLALHLVSPQGTRILLAENRGQDTPDGYGASLSNIVTTNFGARVLDTSWEDTQGSVVGPYPAGTIVSGWRIDSGDIDVVHDQYGLFGVAHTGTNAIDLVGDVDGSVSTNVNTATGRVYQLSFAYCKNPGGPAVTTARVEFNGSPALDFTYALPNSYPSLNWLMTSVVVRATSIVTSVRFRQLSPGVVRGGMFIDTIRMDEVELVTNGTLYATFTDNPAKAIVPIKFAPPPFGDTNFTGTNLFISGFEGARDGLYTNGNTLAGWTVQTNSVYVQSNNVRAYSDTNYLLLRVGAVSRPLPTIAGKEYVLQFATRTSRPLIYSTGVDEDGLPLPADSVDPHYFVSSNSFTLVTNAAYVLRTNAPPMGTSWINRAMPDSRWIGMDGANPPPGTNRYGFRTTFDLTGYDWRNVTLTGEFQSDGSATAILLNGNVVPSGQLGVAIPPQTSYRTGFVALTFTNGFLPGINTFELVVTNSPSPQTNTACGIQIHFGPDAVRATRLGDVTFDDLPGTINLVAIPNGYRSLQWSNFGVLNGSLRPVTSGYRNGMVSPSNVAGNMPGTTNSSIRSSSAFDFNSAYISSVARIVGLQLRVQGFVGTTLVYDNTYFNLTETNSTLIDFNYLGVTEVRFTPYPSTLFVMDNATIRFQGNAPSVYSSIGQIKLLGSYTNYFTASSDFWRVQNVTFVAHSNNTVLEFAGVTPGIWLDHVQMRETGRKYYLPEEPFTPLIGQPSAGRWSLEVWDSRLGAALGNTELVSWRLNLEYVRTNPPFAALRNHQPAGGTVAPGGLRYFAVDVTCSSANVTNTLMSLSPPGALSLLFNQDTFPTGSEPGDFLLIPNTLSNAVSRQVGQYPLLRSGRYYLAVKNTNSIPIDFLVRVDSDNCVKSTPTIGTAKIAPNGFAFTWSAEPGAEFIVEYAEDVAGPWMQVSETITSESGEFSFTDDGSSTGGFTPNRFYRLFRIR